LVGQKVEANAIFMSLVVLITVFPSRFQVEYLIAVCGIESEHYRILGLSASA
jgi:hypothetical protein